MKFSKGDIVFINTREFDDNGHIEYGKRGIIAAVRTYNYNVTFEPGTFPGQEHETWGSYSEDDLRHPTKLEKALQ